MIIDLMAVATAGLVQLAVSGSPNLLHTELQNAGHTGATIIDDARAEIQTATFLYGCPNTGRMGNAGITYEGRRIDINGSDEILAPRGLRVIDGAITMELAMVEPYCSYDHFIVEYSNGRVERWDVGRDEMLDSGRNGVPILLEHNGIPLSASNPTPTSPNSGGGSSGGGAGLALGGIAVAGFLVYSLSGGAANEISWAPQYSFNYNGGANLYSYGSRWEYKKENWRAYWAAQQTGGEEWRYGSGVEWADEVWTAAVSGESAGVVSDINLSVAATKTWQNWEIKSGADAAVRMDKFGMEFSREFFTAIRLRRAPWTISISANLRRRADSSAIAGIKFKRDF